MATKKTPKTPRGRAAAALAANPPAKIESNVLSTKAVLAGLNIRQWSGHKLDRRITDEVNRQHGAQRDAGNYNKLLLAKACFADIDQTTNDSRTLFLIMTMPWLDSGTRVLPSMKYDEFAKRFNELEAQFDAAADVFAENYPRYIEEAKARLNGMFQEADYPHPSRVRGMFAFNVGIMPCPNVEDFRVSLAKEQLDDLRSDLEVKLNEALQSAMKDPVNRVITAVGHMVERLNAYKPSGGKKGQRTEGWFRDSLVTNLKDLVDLLPAFNLTGDVAMTELTQRIEKELCVNEASDLRNNEETRKAVAKAAESILAQAQELMA